MNESTQLTTPPPVDAGAAAELAAFQATIPEQYRSEPSIAVIKSMDGLVKSYIDGQKMIGVPTDRLVTIPNSETASEEDWNNYHTKLGRPEKAEDYKLALPKDLPPGAKTMEGITEKVAQICHKHGLSTKQAQGIFNDYNAVTLDLINAENSTYEATTAAEQEAFKKEWGAAYDAKLDTARRAFAAFGDEKGEFKTWLEETGLGNNPLILKTFSKIGESLMEHSTESGDSGGFRALSPGEAKQEIASLQLDATFQKIYTNKYAPGHVEAVTKMQKLFEYAHPGEPE